MTDETARDVAPANRPPMPSFERLSAFLLAAVVFVALAGALLVLIASDAPTTVRLLVVAFAVVAAAPLAVALRWILGRRPWAERVAQGMLVVIALGGAARMVLEAVVNGGITIPLEAVAALLILVFAQRGEAVVLSPGDRRRAD